MILKNSRPFFFIIFLSFTGLFTQTVSADIEWKLFLKPTMNSGPIMTKTTREGEELILKESDFSQVPSESGDIVSAFDGVSFLIQQAPSSGNISIHIILNVNGNNFDRISGIPLFINISFEVYVNGEKDDFITFDRSPMVINIPQNSLKSLLSFCGLTRENLICVFYSGGGFTDEGISTSDVTTKMIVRIDKPAQFVGGLSDDIGIESKIKIDTWGKIKNLFR